MAPGCDAVRVQVRGADGHCVAQKIVDVQRHAAVTGLRGHSGLQQLLGAGPSDLFGSLRDAGVDRAVRRSRVPEAVAAPNHSAMPRSWAITVGSASTGLTRKPDLGRQIINILLRRRLSEGHRQHVSVELDPDRLELLGHGVGHGRRASGLGVMAARSTAGSWARWASAPDHHPGKCQIPADQHGGQRLAGLLGLLDQGGKVGLGLVSALDQCLGQSGRPFRTRRCGEGTHATTRSTSSRVVSPSMALRRPLRRSVTIPWVTASLWISSTDPPSIIIRSISSLIGISSANAFRPR